MIAAQRGSKAEWLREQLRKWYPSDQIEAWGYEELLERYCEPYAAHMAAGR